MHAKLLSNNQVTNQGMVSIFMRGAASARRSTKTATAR